jgi:hypothetical protein
MSGLEILKVNKDFAMRLAVLQAKNGDFASISDEDFLKVYRLYNRLAKDLFVLREGLRSLKTGPGTPGSIANDAYIDTYKQLEILKREKNLRFGLGS